MNENRQPSISTKIGLDASLYLREKYLLEISGVDVIIGYRADDSYFSFARNFLNNQITLQQLEKARKEFQEEQRLGGMDGVYMIDLIRGREVL